MKAKTITDLNKIRQTCLTDKTWTVEDELRYWRRREEIKNATKKAAWGSEEHLAKIKRPRTKEQIAKWKASIEKRKLSGWKPQGVRGKNTYTVEHIRKVIEQKGLVDNKAKYSEVINIKRLQLATDIRELFDSGMCVDEVARITQIQGRSIKRYLIFLECGYW